MAGVHDYQTRYWKQLVQLKHDIEYLRLYNEDSVQKEKKLNASLAILSAGSLALWVVIGKIALLWAAIIVATQLVNAIKPHLPYQQRMKHTAELATEVQGLFLYSERRWFEVAEGMLEDEKIHHITMEIRQRRDQVERNHFKGDPLPEYEKHRLKAEERTETYFKTFYGGEVANG